MRSFKQEWCKRLFSAFLILCMLSTSSALTALAGYGPPTSSGKPHQEQTTHSGVGTVSDNISKGSGQITSFDPSCSWAQNPGYIIKLVSIENKCDASYTSLIESGKLTENQASLMKAYYVYFPTHDFIDDPGTIVSESAFVSYCGSNSNSAIRKTGSIHLGDEKGYATNETFKHVFYSQSTSVSAWQPTDIATSQILGNPTLYTAFKNHELSLSQINTTPSAAAMQNVANAFHTMGSLAQCFQDNTWINKPTMTEDEYYKSRLQVLDLFLAINGMCGGVYTSEIQEYLTTLNENNASNFVQPMITAVCMVRPNGDNTVSAFTLPMYYATLDKDHNYAKYSRGTSGKKAYSESDLINSYKLFAHREVIIIILLYKHSRL